VQLVELQSRLADHNVTGANGLGRLCLDLVARLACHRRVGQIGARVALVTRESFVAIDDVAGASRFAQLGLDLLTGDLRLCDGANADNAEQQRQRGGGAIEFHGGFLDD
jgi:hypothetical protein